MARKKKRNGTVKPPSGNITFLSKITIAPDNRFVFWAAVMAAILTVVMYYPNHGGDYDVWWHMKYGEHFVRDMTWSVDHTAYSWTPANGAWKYVTWLGSSFLYIVYTVAGFAGLSVFQLLALLASGLLYLWFVRGGGGSPGIAHIAFLLAAAVAVNPTAIYIKPELFTLVFFTVAVFVYFRAKRGARRLLWVYPPLFLVWVNTHGAFLIGLMFVTMALVMEAFAYLARMRNSLDRKTLTLFAGATALSYIVLAVNPHGPSYPLETVGRLLDGDSGYQDILMAYINRWQYLFPDVYVFRRTNTAWALVGMFAAMIAGFIHAFRKRGAVDIALVALNIAFFYFSMKMARATLYFPLIWLFSMEYTVCAEGNPKAWRSFALPALAVIVMTSALCLWNTVTVNTYDSWFGSNIDAFVPDKEAAFVREHGLPHPMFNDYLSGGYLLWSLYPDYRVFIDPRHRPFEATGVWDDYIGLRQQPTMENLQRFNTKYPFKTAFVHHVKYNDIMNIFLQSPEWGLVYFDTTAAVFVHASETEALQAAKSADLGPARFRNIDNPAILMSLFRLYYAINLDGAREIMHIYRDNVSRFYVLRDKNIGYMISLLGQAGLDTQ